MDPKDMSDEQLDAAINSNPNEPEDQGDPSVDPTPPQPNEPEGQTRGPDGRFVSKPNEEEPADEPAGEPEPEPQVNPDEPKPPSRREQLRIQQVLERVKQGQPRAQQPTSQRPGAIDYANELDADPDVIARLEEDRKVAENARYQEGLQQAQSMQWHTLLQVDAPMVEREHPQLDKRSPEFHPALANSLSTMYLQMSGFDQETGLAASPGMRWSDFVDSVWELADEIANTKTEQVRTQVAKQAAQTGLRPEGSATRLNLNKAPEHMSDKELEAFLDSQGLNPQPRR